MIFFVCTSNSGKLREFKSALESLDSDRSGDQGSVYGLECDEKALFREPIEDCDFFAGNAVKKLIASCEFSLAVERLGSTTFCSGRRPQYLIVDDSGLCLPQLGFEPGVHSAYYAGVPRSDEKNRKKLAQKVREVAGQIGESGREKRLEGFFVSLILCLKWPQAFDCNTGQRSDNNCVLRAISSAQVSLSKTWEENIFQSLLRRAQNESLTFIGHSERVQMGLLNKSDRGGFELSAHFGLSLGEISETEQNLLAGEGHGYDAIFYPKTLPHLSFASIPLDVKNTMSHRGVATRSLIDFLSNV